MSRLNENDSLQEAILKLVDGNPGAITATMEMIKRQGQITGFVNLFHMDDTALYGPRIWILWKDVCHFDGIKFDNLIQDRKSFNSEINRLLIENPSFARDWNY